jgi:plasmid replication initiation protein
VVLETRNQLAWSDDVDEETQQSQGMSLTLSDWFYEGILMDGGLLGIDPAYFAITGGRERWLYRVARKHAGGAGEGGFAIPLPTLFEKSGAEGTYRRFKFEIQIQAIARRNNLPGFELFLEWSTKEEPALRMNKRMLDTPGLGAASRPRAASRRQAAARPPQAVPPLFKTLTDETRERIRRDFPGWDLYALQSEFDAWIAEKDEPADYQAAFYGFVRRHHTGI